MKSPVRRTFLSCLLTCGLLAGCATPARAPVAPPEPAVPAVGGEAAATAESREGAFASAPPADLEKGGGPGEDAAVGVRAAEPGDSSPAWEMVEEPSAAGATTRAAPAATPSASGLQAGFADDNRQFNYFVGFLAEYGPQAPHLPIPVEERIVLKVLDSAGKSIPNAEVSISAGAGVLASGRTYSDGTFLFFPSEHDAAVTRYTASVKGPRQARRLDIERAGKREVEVKLQEQRPAFQNVPLDILFVLDTTGSMGEEIQRLKTTLEIINLNLASLSSKPRVRFGLVLYRDEGDDYVTQVVPLTGDVAAFRRALEPVRADGGGDDPEDLQSALRDAMQEVRWSPDGVRLAFVITDAAPHLDYGQRYTYVDAVHDAREAGIKIFTVGTGGLDITGELPLRQIAQYTAAKYIFLTYGERGESGGGAPGSVSHHTGSNFQTDKLEAIIIRFAKEELANLADQPLEDGEDWFQATSTTGEEKAQTLAKLFDMALSQIVDYASFRIPPGTPVAALPVVAQSSASAADAEYFGEQEVLSLARSKAFSMVERRDLQAILEELELQMSGIADEENAAKVGKLLNAAMLLTARMFDTPEGYEVFLKLLRVETGEILSVTRLLIDRKLGLSR